FGHNRRRGSQSPRPPGTDRRKPLPLRRSPMFVPRQTRHRFGDDASPSGAPPLTALAEVVHQGTFDEPSDLVVLCGYGTESVDLGFWPIPPEVEHPTDVLVGWKPPEWASVVGLVTNGEARSADSIDSVRVTVTMSVDGQSATVLERAGHAPETLAEPPQGWGAVALRCCLGLPTAAPGYGLHVCVEGHWLREIIGLLADDAVHDAPVTWDQVALVHPLHPSGWPAPPSQLRSATAALETEST